MTTRTQKIPIEIIKRRFHIVLVVICALVATLIFISSYENVERGLSSVHRKLLFGGRHIRCLTRWFNDLSMCRFSEETRGLSDDKVQQEKQTTSPNIAHATLNLSSVIHIHEHAANSHNPPNDADRTKLQKHEEQIPILKLNATGQPQSFPVQPRIITNVEVNKTVTSQPKISPSLGTQQNNYTEITTNKPAMTAREMNTHVVHQQLNSSTGYKTLSYDSILSAELMKRKTTTNEEPLPMKDLNDPIDCGALFDGNKAEQERVDLLQKLHPYHPLTPADYISLTTNNCTAFRSQFLSSSSVSDEERVFPLAFSIRLHKSVEQAARLLRAVYRPHNVYCLHVDAKSPSELRAAIEAIANCLPNVELSSRTVNVVYGSFAQTEADLICMEDLVKHKVQWKYYLNLAGTEFPLKTNAELVTVLKYLNGTNDIEQYYFPKHYYYRFNTTHVIKEDTIVSTNISKAQFSYPGMNITYLKGCSYNSFSREFVVWLLTADLPQAFIAWARDTMAPDELIWATLNPFGPGGYPVLVTQTAKTFLSREVIWTYSAAYCNGQFVHGICILNHRNLPWLSGRWEFFANKFDLETDATAYWCLEQALLDRVKHQSTEAIPWYGVDRAPHVYFTRVLHKNVTAAVEKKIALVYH